MPRTWKHRANVLVLGGLLTVQIILLSLQVPLGAGPNVFEKAVFFLFAPLQRVVSAAGRGMDDLWGSYIRLRTASAANDRLAAEAARLRQENALLRARLGVLEDREAAAETLRSLGHAYRFASVIGVDALNPYKMVTIDAGSAQGLRPDMPVLDGLGRLVGRVVAPVGLAEAAVQLITDDASAVSVFAGTGQVMGVLSGDGTTGRCLMKYVSATNEGVSAQDILLTSGFDRVYPPGLSVGTVIEVGADTTLFKRITVVPAFDFRDLRVVAVLTGGRGAEAGK